MHPTDELSERDLHIFPATVTHLLWRIHTNGREKVCSPQKRKHLHMLEEHFCLAWIQHSGVLNSSLGVSLDQVHEYTVGYLHFKTPVSIQLPASTVQRPEEMSTEREEANVLSISCKQNEITGKANAEFDLLKLKVNSLSNCWSARMKPAANAYLIYKLMAKYCISYNLKIPLHVAYCTCNWQL